ncbi:hypothetical protein IAQ61_002660 [Plenodomus lingam]|uniref:uncharacterized protein n=1 Tax=Leptosphaeria maculans TaxID=5022 RepID=UPI003317A29F|nr:hypothetical protein IAQ61_002660 [Plenodomus lingam]
MLIDISSRFGGEDSWDLVDGLQRPGLPQYDVQSCEAYRAYLTYCRWGEGGASDQSEATDGGWWTCKWETGWDCRIGLTPPFFVDVLPCEGRDGKWDGEWDGEAGRW